MVDSVHVGLQYPVTLTTMIIYNKYRKQVKILDVLRDYGV